MTATLPRSLATAAGVRRTAVGPGASKPSVVTLSVARARLTEQAAWRWALRSALLTVEGHAPTDWAALRAGRDEARARRLHVGAVEVAA